MDQETRSTLERHEKEIKDLRDGFRCPQTGCRFMESKGAKRANIANWLTAVGIIFLIAERFIGGFK